MYLENARALVQGSIVLLSVAIAIMGFLLVQSSVTDWCIPDPFLKRLGLKKKLQSGED
jgi:hypothetical protein